LKLDPNYDYQIAFKRGSLKDMGLEFANKNGGFRVDGTLIEDLKTHENLLIQEGGFFVYRTSKSGAVELVDFISRKSALTRAVTQILTIVGVVEDHQVLKNNVERGFQAALVDMGDYVDGFLKQHPEMFKAAELAEVRRTLATVNTGQLIDVKDSLEAQAKLDEESSAGRLVDWIVKSGLVDEAVDAAAGTKAAEPNADVAGKSDVYKGFRETHGYKILKEYVRLLFQPGTFITLGFIAFVANADHLYSTSTAIISKLFPMPLVDSYRPIQWRSRSGAPPQVKSSLKKWNRLASLTAGRF
jgi:uncharacterized membrane protein